MPRPKVFTVGLSDGERELLTKVVSTGTHPAQMMRRARVLLELDENAGTQVELVERTTPTAGRDLNFIEQMLGNVGRFSGGNGGFRQPGVPRR